MAERLPPGIDWRFSPFDALSPFELARIYRARQQVFAIEQQCAYLDADGFDELSHHLAAWSPELLGATARIARLELANPASALETAYRNRRDTRSI